MARIFVIDDQASVRGAIRAVLSAAGHAVEEASNGSEAMERLSSDYDLVITDVLMPVMDGFEVVRRVKHLRRDLPVLAITAGLQDDSLDLLELARKLGADRTLSKSLIGTQLAATVGEMLGGG